MPMHLTKPLYLLDLAPVEGGWLNDSLVRVNIRHARSVHRNVAQSEESAVDGITISVGILISWLSNSLTGAIGCCRRG